jgi:hypothetical protein
MMNPIAIVFKVLGGIFLFFGLICLAGAGWTGYRQYTLLERWPQVDAAVTQCRMNSQPMTYTDTNNQRITTTEYSLALEFRYTVAGREYTSPASSSLSSDNYNVMRRKADEYAPGTHHPIRYNPDDPKDIRYDVSLNIGFAIFAVILGIFGVIATAVGGAMLRAFRRRRCPACGQVVPTGMLNCPHCNTPLPVK